LLTEDLLSFDVVQIAAQRVTALLVEDPRIALVDFVAVHANQVFDARKLGELRLGNAAQREETRSEPNLFDVRLMGVLCDDLLNRELFPTLYVSAQPH
jgi:hypothetical protein